MVPGAERAGLAAVLAAAVLAAAAAAPAVSARQAAPPPAGPAQEAQPQPTEPAQQPLSQPTAAAPRPVPFAATYKITWHGMAAGSSTLELRETAPQSYLYTSTDTARGLFRLVFPRPLRQSSRFRITDGEVQPLAFEAGGAGNEVMAQFDWEIGHVTGRAKGKRLDLKLQPGTQDPLSVQIAIMLKLQADAAPSSFWMLNTDEIDRFEYVRHEETTLDTPLGRLRTILYTSHAPGSDKTTYLWLAPALEYMPARAEQRVKGNTQMSLAIRAFTRQ